MKIEKWSVKKSSRAVNAFLARSAFSPETEAAAAKVLADVRKRGNAAVLEATAKFDHAEFGAGKMRVSKRELAAAAKKVPEHIKASVELAYERVRNFAEAGLREAWYCKTPAGGYVGEFYSPMDRVGVYVPGGTAPLASTAIMTATFASVAGVEEIVACTPCAADGSVNPVTLYALQRAGATEIYRIGGIQSIGMMAYGTETVKKVRKIVGPGNAYVTAAKRQVYGEVSIDQVAGPSEIAVLADETANPAWVAADLLSQAEHGSGHEKALLVCTSEVVAQAVCAELLAQMKTLSRAAMVQRVLDAGGIMLVTVPDTVQGMELVNRFAPEHFEIHTKDYDDLIPLVRAAGAVFIGPYTPESAGDFVAGPSHVLPTGGAALMFNGLTVDDFRLRHSFVKFTKKELKETLPAIKTFAEVEGLDAHGRSATIRFE